MHILFVDESGTVPPPDKSNTRHFVLGGVIISEDIWGKVENDLKMLKTRYDVTGEIKWRYFSPHNNRGDNTLRHLEPSRRNALRNDMLGTINKYRSVRLLASIAHIKAAYTESYINDKNDLYAFAYKILAERFQYFLQDLGRDSGIGINGIIVCDHRNANEDKHLRNFHYRMVSTDGGFTSRFDNLIESLFIAPSHHSVGIQFADLVAGAVFRKVEKNDTQFFDAIRGSFRTGPKGKIDGYGVARLAKAHWPRDGGRVD